MTREVVTSENREEYINKKLARSQAKKGGEVAESNQYHYKGGQFLPSTAAEPGKWKIGKKWIHSGKELVEPGVYEHQPTPFSRAILGAVGHYGTHENGKLKLRNDVYVGEGSNREKLSPETTTRLGIKGKLSKNEHTYGQLVNEYNKGNRWVHLEFDEPTLTTK